MAINRIKPAYADKQLLQQTEKCDHSQKMDEQTFLIIELRKLLHTADSSHISEQFCHHA